MLISKGVLKFVYSALLTGLPSITYNPINKNILHAPFDVNQYSTYLNFRLNDHERNTISKFIEKNNNDLEIEKIKLLENSQDEDYFLSINIYNCTSPIFSFIDENYVTRCELNIYVKDCFCVVCVVTHFFSIYRIDGYQRMWVLST